MRKMWPGQPGRWLRGQGTLGGKAKVAIVAMGILPSHAISLDVSNLGYIFLWRFPKMGVPQNIPKWMV